MTAPARHVASIALDVEDLRRGGTTRIACCVCGWRGPERGTMELAADDALTHEREANNAIEECYRSRAEICGHLRRNPRNNAIEECHRIRGHVGGHHLFHEVSRKEMRERAGVPRIGGGQRGYEPAPALTVQMRAGDVTDHVEIFAGGGGQVLPKVPRGAPTRVCEACNGSRICQDELGSRPCGNCGGRGVVK